MLNRNKINDFFFGDITFTKGVARKDLYDVMDLADHVSGDYFSAQLNRVLVTLGGKFVLNHDSSCPDVYQLFDKIPLNNIGKIEIEKHTDINNSVPCTLGCKVYLEQGFLDIQAHWCAYKEVRAEEIFTSLIAPIHQYKLADKTYINDGEELSKLNEYGSEYAYEVKDILSLASCDWHHENKRFVDSMASILCSADEQEQFSCAKTDTSDLESLSKDQLETIGETILANSTVKILLKENS